MTGAVVQPMSTDDARRLNPRVNCGWRGRQRLAPPPGQERQRGGACAGASTDAARGSLAWRRDAALGAPSRRAGGTRAQRAKRPRRAPHAPMSLDWLAQGAVLGPVTTYLPTYHTHPGWRLQQQGGCEAGGLKRGRARSSSWPGRRSRVVNKAMWDCWRFWMSVRAKFGGHLGRLRAAARARNVSGQAPLVAVAVAAPV
jgi:hypothetical protein